MNKEIEEQVTIASAELYDMKYEVMISASYEVKRKSGVLSRAWRGIFGF